MTQPHSWVGEDAQLEKPYHSTVALDDFLHSNGVWKPNSKVLDIGTGIGANLFYFRHKRPSVEFLGIDYNPEKIEQGRRVIEARKAQGIALEVGDIWKLPTPWINSFDGVIVIHTLCVFRQIEPFIDALVRLKPRWIAINSLFYPGPLDVLIHIRDLERPWLADDNPDGDFNIFSLTKASELFAAQGYRMISAPFYPPVELPKPPAGARGTYTMATDLSSRTQFSGPVHLPWCFVLAMREG